MSRTKRLNESKNNNYPTLSIKRQRIKTIHTSPFKTIIPHPTATTSSLSTPQSKYQPSDQHSSFVGPTTPHTLLLYSVSHTQQQSSLTPFFPPPPPPFSPPLTAFSDHFSGDLTSARLLPLNRLLFPITFQLVAGDNHNFLKIDDAWGQEDCQSYPCLSAAVLKSDACAYFTNRNVIPGKVGILSENVVSSVNAGFGNMKVSEQSVHYPSSICYDHHYPGPSDNHHQLGGSCSCHQNCNGTSYKDNGSPLYYMHNGYNPYAFTSVDPQFSSSECYSMNCARYQDPTSYGSKYTMCSDGSLKSSGINTKRSMTAFDERFPSYLLDMQSRQSTSNISQSVLQSSHLCSLNKVRFFFF
ncbi:hypothetical protein Hanom_Chr03g00216421 [Helianthus anomalus]